MKNYKAKNYFTALASSCRRAAAVSILGGMLMLLQLPAEAADSARITGFSVSTGNAALNIGFVVTAIPQYHVFTLQQPSRIVIDFQNVTVATHFNLRALPPSVVKNIRTGVHEGGILRVVLDVPRLAPFHIVTSKYRHQQLLNVVIKAPMLNAHKAQPRALSHSTAAPAHTALPLPTTLKPPQPNPPVSQPSLQPIHKQFSLLHTAKFTPKYSVALLEPDHAQKLRDVIIVIDPGHGGKDPGASGGVHGVKEKDVVLAVAKDLQQELNEKDGFSAILTRDDDHYVSLHERLHLAHINKADMFLSLHADAYKSHAIKGASVFTLAANDAATSDVAKWLAARENISELGMEHQGKADKDLRLMLLGLTQNAAIKTSLLMGDIILPKLADSIPLHTKRIEQASFVVLQAPDIPSLLVETGYLSDDVDEEHLSDVQYQTKFAHALAQGIITYFTQHPPPSSLLATSHNVK